MQWLTGREIPLEQGIKICWLGLANGFELLAVGDLSKAEEWGAWRSGSRLTPCHGKLRDWQIVLKNSDWLQPSSLGNL